MQSIKNCYWYLCIETDAVAISIGNYCDGLVKSAMNTELDRVIMDTPIGFP